MAVQPNDVWRWDITRLPGPARGIWYQLYVRLDIFSRYPVGRRLEEIEDAAIGEQWMADLVALHGRPGAIHADRGPSMSSKNVVQRLVDLGVQRSHSRPRVSNERGLRLRGDRGELVEVRGWLRWTPDHPARCRTQVTG